MPNGPKAIPNEKLRRFVKCSISNHEVLSEFIECSLGDIPPWRDEGLVCGLAIRCPEDLWHLPVIQNTVSKAVFQNQNVSLLFSLLSGTIAPSELSCSLDKLLARGSQVLTCSTFYQVLVSLHRRKLINAKDFFLPRLGWFSPIDLWYLAIVTLRICEPPVLLDSRLMRIPRMRSAGCRALLGILAADLTSNSTFAREMSELCGLKKREHSKVVILISEYCLGEGGNLASAMVREMTARKDYRDLDLIQAAAHASSLKSK